MKEISITARMRADRGKGSARQTRRDGYVPGVVYGPDIEPVALAVNERELRAALKSATGGSIFNLSIDGKDNKTIVREIQRDPITSRVIHVDFHAISMNKPINVAVPIKFTGTPRGVKTDGGIMQTTMRELSVSCLPTDIPDSIAIDVADLGIGDSIHVRDLDLPQVKILSEERRTIVVIAAPTVIKATAAELEAAEEEAAAEAAAEGEEGEEKPEEKAGEKTEGKD